MCHGRGPAWPDDTASTAIIGQRQADKAQQLWRDKGNVVSGDIDYRHVFIDMTSVQVQESNFTRAGKTCKAAMGFSFAAGTTDGKNRGKGLRQTWLCSGLLVVLACYCMMLLHCGCVCSS